jgi:type I restriction enzyme S subunit
MNIKISDIAEEIRDSYTPNKNINIPYIGLEHVEQDTLHISSVGSSLDVKSNKFHFQKGDILFGTLRPYFRKIIITQFNGICSTEFSVIRPKNKKDLYFTFYGMAQPEFIKYATSNSNGARPRTKWDLFSDYKFKDFSQAKRQNIGNILFKYDELIENNRKRIQLLEKSAHFLYKEWFVNLRFPGHEHVKIIDGVPEGWERKKLGDIIQLNYGKALKKENRIPGDFPVYGSSGIVGSHIKPLISGPNIILGRKGNVGSVFWSSKPCHPIDTVYYISPDQSSLFLYYALKNTSFISTDVAVPGLNRDLAYSRFILKTENKIQRLF